MNKTIIIGVGSILRGDDGLGIRVIDELEKEPLPSNITLHSGDISGIDLLKYFPDFERVIIVDTADMKESPGTVRVFGSAEIKKNGFQKTVSTHGMALLETLMLAEKLDIQSKITVIGVQPGNTSPGVGLTGIIENRIPSIVSIVKDILQA